MISAAYRPLSRRPIAGVFRRTANWAVGFCIKVGISADVVSYSSIVVSALAALCFWQSGRRPLLLIWAPLLCYVRLWLNMLDGLQTSHSSWATRSIRMPWLRFARGRTS